LQRVKKRIRIATNCFSSQTLSLHGRETELGSELRKYFPSLCTLWPAVRMWDETKLELFLQHWNLLAQGWATFVVTFQRSVLDLRSHQLRQFTTDLLTQLRSPHAPKSLNVHFMNHLSQPYNIRGPTSEVPRRRGAAVSWTIPWTLTTHFLFLVMVMHLSIIQLRRAQAVVLETQNCFKPYRKTKARAKWNDCRLEEIRVSATKTSVVEVTKMSSDREEKRRTWQNFEKFKRNKGVEDKCLSERLKSYLCMNSQLQEKLLLLFKKRRQYLGAGSLSSLKLIAYAAGHRNQTVGDVRRKTTWHKSDFQKQDGGKRESVSWKSNTWQLDLLAIWMAPCTREGWSRRREEMDTENRESEWWCF
jgi:hypothetical protein